MPLINQMLPPPLWLSSHSPKSVSPAEQSGGRLPTAAEMTEAAILNNGSLLPQTSPPLTPPEDLKKRGEVPEIASKDKPSFYSRLSATLIEIWRNLIKSQRLETELSGQFGILAYKNAEAGAKAMNESALKNQQGTIISATVGMGFAVSGAMNKIHSNTRHGEQSARLLERNQTLRTDINANKKLIQGNNLKLENLHQESRFQMKQSEKLNTRNRLLETEKHELSRQKTDIDNRISATREAGYGDKALQERKREIDKQITARDKSIKANNKQLETLDAAEERRDNQRNTLREANDSLSGKNGDLELEIENNNIELNRLHILQDNGRSKGDALLQMSHPVSEMVKAPSQVEAAELSSKAKLNETAADIAGQSARNRQEAAHQNVQSTDAMQRALKELQSSQNATLDAMLSNHRV